MSKYPLYIALYSLLHPQEEDIQGDGTANGSSEKQDNNERPTNTGKTEITENAEMEDSEVVLSGLGSMNIKKTQISIAKTKIQDTQTAEEVEKNECSSLTNVEIPSEEQRLFIHGSWLAVQSSYFRALFYSSGMKESFSKEIILKVTDEELEAHYTLIKAMYQPSTLDHMDPFLVLQVLRLAHKYDVSLIFKKCKYVLMSATMSLELCESVFTVVNGMLDTDDLMEHLRCFLVNAFKPLDKVWITDEFKNLSEVSLRILLSCNELTVLSENTVFVALMWWCEHNDYNGPSLLSLLRPELMTVEFLQEVVYNHHQAKQMDGYNKLLMNGFRYHSSSPKRKALLENEITRRVEYKADNEPSFTWQFHISEDNPQDSPEMYKSERFWWCGFEMMLSLTLESNLWSVCLYVLNIEDVSSLKFVWVIEAGLFPVIIRRQVTFRNRFDLGFDKTEFPFSQPIQRNSTRFIKVFIRFAISSSLSPVSYESLSDANEFE